jgi:hypothetical protein
MANSATQIKICGAGGSEDCVVSKAHAFPIQMLREGKPISHNNGTPCDAACVAAAWESRNRNPQLISTCPPSDLPGTVYHACGNEKGLHFVSAKGGVGGFCPQCVGNMEVSINTAVV